MYSCDVAMSNWVAATRNSRASHMSVFSLEPNSCEAAGRHFDISSTNVTASYNNNNDDDNNNINNKPVFVLDIHLHVHICRFFLFLMAYPVILYNCHLFSHFNFMFINFFSL